MAGDYALGVFFAILCGVMNALGTLLQKSAVNKILLRTHEGSFTAQFMRSPIWLTGLVVTVGLGTTFNLASQSRIGPALVPALTSSGLIILAIGSVKLLRERLKPSDWMGIVCLVFGIALLGFSELEIPQSAVDLLNYQTQHRLVSFSIGLLLCWGLSGSLAQRIYLSRGLLLAFSSGLPYCLSNMWILPMLMTIGLVFSGKAQVVQVVIFIVSCIILVSSNLVGIRQTQEAYRFAPASKALPIQMVPTQIVPILIYLLVFQRSITGVAILLVLLGVAFILIGGFLLGKRGAGPRNATEVS
jgi:drug/metabolite transporter (DMT)-like permease